jgi:hypothetical protein
VIIRQMTVEHSDRYPLMTCTHPPPKTTPFFLPHGANSAADAVMDVSHMDFDDESFDLVLDKGLAPTPGQGG